MEYKRQILEGIKRLAEIYTSREHVYVVELMQQNSKFQMQKIDIKPFSSSEKAHEFIAEKGAVPEVFKYPRDRSVIYYNIYLRDKANY